ncbi:hypothetical protein [Sulfurimonas sp.]|uniref:hypothetical protein n=1 Tax=Sulfurimonas sp. TaxID=2022749 RepID=UPI0025E65B0E|nr:hypothetical protein [Sulfurimonas sp.]MBW6488466.1 EAL domain-containing protein [Sulfurimonas sp.]
MYEVKSKERDGEITLRYQPQMSINSEVTWCEVLARRYDEQLGDVAQKIEK